MARLRARGHVTPVRPVLNLSEGGMLVVADGLDVGDFTAFELCGWDFRYAGTAVVAHCTDDATGLRVLAWQGPAYRRIRALILARIPWNDVASESPFSGFIPNEFLG